MKYQKKPVVIDAQRWDGNPDTVFALTDSGEPWPEEVVFHPNTGELEIGTLEGSMICNVGDWLIRGVKREFYPIKDEIFQASYEVAEECLPQ